LILVPAAPNKSVAVSIVFWAWREFHDAFLVGIGGQVEQSGERAAVVADL
jgi:hypothetical protein